ncbi:MAG: adenine deaminase [Saprospiraceae bacterium]|jgi:adenine deaminase
MQKKIQGHIVDIEGRRTYPGELQVEDGVIQSIIELPSAPERFIMPGFIDAHIHIESSMLVPYEFARIALRHGTIATVSDPHEIANVMGVEGVHYMIKNARDAKMKFHFGAPSCVPATSFESAGATINADAIKDLLASPDIHYLSEMMNYPGVLASDAEILLKIQHAKDAQKQIDGHAPGLRGVDAQKYIAAGISTDHECFTLEEALDKIKYGMKIIIREGSAAKNFDALHTLIGSNPSTTMFCSDDKHPDDLLVGHINQLVSRSLELGYNLYDILQIACINPKKHYDLKSGILSVGDPADFIIVKDLQSFEVISTYIDGSDLIENGSCLLPKKSHSIINNFNAKEVNPTNFEIKAQEEPFPVIRAIGGELITEKESYHLPSSDGNSIVDIENDILKIAVVNRYQKAPIALGFIQGFGLNNGAIASSVAHDSHNIIVVGVDDESIAGAVNLLVASKGGLSAVGLNESHHLALPIAGLMSERSCEEVGYEYAEIDLFTKSLGSTLSAPFMTLSFMALLVIPKIKISDKGMFDAESFKLF